LQRHPAPAAADRRLADQYRVLRGAAVGRLPRQRAGPGRMAAPAREVPEVRVSVGGAWAVHGLRRVGIRSFAEISQAAAYWRASNWTPACAAAFACSSNEAETCSWRNCSPQLSQTRAGTSLNPRTNSPRPRVVVTT